MITPFRPPPAPAGPDRDLDPTNGRAGSLHRPPFARRRLHRADLVAVRALALAMVDSSSARLARAGVLRELARGRSEILLGAVERLESHAHLAPPALLGEALATLRLALDRPPRRSGRLPFGTARPASTQVVPARPAAVPGRPRSGTPDPLALR